MAKKKMKGLDLIATILVLVGALNWGLVGLLDFNLVTSIFSTFAQYVYIVVGLSALYSAYKIFK